MGLLPPPDEPPPPPMGWQEFYDACNSFEDEWRAGSRPRIEDYLGRATEPVRPPLVRELLRIELGYRRWLGEAPAEEEYRGRFPEQAPLIGAVLHEAGAEPTPAPPALPQFGVGAAVAWCLLFCFFSVLASCPCALVIPLLGDRPRRVQFFVVGSLATFVVAALMVRNLFGAATRRCLALRRPSAVHLLLVVLLVGPECVLSVEAANWAARAFDSPPGPEDTGYRSPGRGQHLARAGTLDEWEKMYQEVARQPWWLILLAGCLLPALGEEAFCRAFLGGGLVARRGVVLGVLVTSLLFGLLHVDPVRVCATAVLGLSLHVVFLTTRSYWSPVLLHALHNTLAFAATRLSQDTGHDPTGQYDSAHLPTPLVLAAGAAVALLWWVLYRTRTRWVLPEGGEWSPGYVTAEMPPAGVGAVARVRLPGPLSFCGATGAYLGFAAAALLYVGPGAPHTPYDYNERGNAHIEKGELHEALAEYSEAIRLDPGCACAYANRGLVRVRQGLYAAALPDLDQAIRLDPKMAEAYLNRGVARHNLGRYDEAIADYDRAIALAPKEVLAYTNRGLAYLAKGDAARALEDLDEAVRREPGNAGPWFWRGQAHVQKGEYDRAVEDLTEAIRLNPRDAKAYYLRGVALQGAGEPARAEADFKKAKEIDPKVAEGFK
jgi:Tfp pilus assembly protein PilF/membrane protease YdiL (CAAX protease family)